MKDQGVARGILGCFYLIMMFLILVFSMAMATGAVVWVFRYVGG